MFPARVKSPVRTLPGLGTPDLLGRLGVGTYFTTDKEVANQPGRKTPVAVLTKKGSTYHSQLLGPMRKVRGGAEPAALDVQIDPHSNDSATVIIGSHKLVLHKGEWSPIIELKFKVGRFVSIQALTSVIITKLGADVCLYALPLQVHPLKAPWHYGTPRNFVKDSWNSSGPFLTVGWRKTRLRWKTALLPISNLLICVMPSLMCVSVC